jgi:hypothetical protein
MKGKGDTGELAEDVEQRPTPERQRRPAQDVPDAAILLPGETGEPLGVTRRDPLDRRRPAPRAGGDRPLAISADPDTALASWARDSEFPFLFASDSALAVARKYGALASEPGLTNRNLFVVGPDGRIAYRAIPFREIDPSAYKALGAAIERTR